VDAAKGRVVKGGITLAIYIAIGFIPVAFGQSSTYVKTITTVRVTDPPPLVIAPPPVPTVGVIKPAPLAERSMPETIVIIKHGRGGRIDAHTLRYADFRLIKARVEVRGPCYSACTMVLSYVGPELLCVAPGAFMAFHAVRSAETHKILKADTEFLYTTYPLPIRQWIDAHGGWKALPLDGFWTMQDRDLWAVGYPKCQ